MNAYLEKRDAVIERSKDPWKFAQKEEKERGGMLGRGKTKKFDLDDPDEELKPSLLKDRRRKSPPPEEGKIRREHEDKGGKLLTTNATSERARAMKLIEERRRAVATGNSGRDTPMTSVSERWEYSNMYNKEATREAKRRRGGALRDYDRKW
jgi:hypothetical protein